MISRILRFTRKKPKGVQLGPKGAYQYGIPTPDLKFCLLADTNLYAVDIKSRKRTKIAIGKVNLLNYADPSLGSGDIGYNGNLSGDYMEIAWLGNRKGKLLIKSPRRELLNEIEFKLPSGKSK
jgi:hypothetical protein